MKSSQRKHFFVGIFVMIGLSIFIVTIYLVGKKENLFGSPVTISAIFKDVQGLRAGDKVRLSGIDIGTVSSLTFMKSNQVSVKMNLDADLIEFVKKDAKVTISSEGLMGSKVVTILPGSINAGGVQANDTLSTIPQISIDEILKKVDKSGENIAVISEEIMMITKKINRGDGVFGKIFTDTSLTGNLDDAARNISHITENLSEISNQVNQGKGIVGRLFADTTLSSEIGSAGENINEIAGNIVEITDKINRGEGIFGRMFTDTSLTNNLYITSKNLESTTRSLSTLAHSLNNDSSSLDLFIDDAAFADSIEVLIARMNIGIIELTKAADAIQRSGIVRFGAQKKKEDKTR